MFSGFPINYLYSSIDSYEYDKFIDTSKNQRYANNSLKLQQCITQSVSLDTISSPLPSLFCFEYLGWSFDFFYKHLDNSQNIYIIFSGASDNIPSFKRHSWNYFFDGSVLYISDPMLKKYNNLCLGWYLGDNNDDLYEMITDILYKIIKISEKINVICYGSSGGGYACLKYSQINDTKCIVINPQIFLKKFDYYKKFLQITKIKEDELFLNRIKIGINNNSKYFIIQNETCKHDCECHIFPVLKQFGVYPKYGLMRFNTNINLWLYHAFGGHNAQEDKNLLQFILYAADKLFDKSTSENDFLALNACTIGISNLWAEYAWLREANNNKK